MRNDKLKQHEKKKANNGRLFRLKGKRSKKERPLHKKRQEKRENSLHRAPFDIDSMSDASDSRDKITNKPTFSRSRFLCAA